jgi:hypothetical protein
VTSIVTATTSASGLVQLIVNLRKWMGDLSRALLGDFTQ